MNVQIRNDKQRIRAGNDELDMEQAVQLARDLIDAVTQCGHEVKMNVEVPKHQPSDAQLRTAITRVAHLRRTYADREWTDDTVNRTLVEHVLKACL